MDISYRWIMAEEELEEIAPKWRTLHASNPAHSAFLSYEWLSAWWRHFGQGRALEVLCAQHPNGSLAAIAPLCATPRRLFGKSVYREWCLLGAESVACSDHLGFLQEPGVNPQIFDYMLDQVARRMQPGDTLHFTDLDNSAGLVDAALAWAASAGLQADRLPGQACPAVRLPADWNGYLADLSSNFRAQIRQSLRRITGDSSLEVIRIGDPGQARVAVEDLIRLNTSRLTEKGIRSTLTNPRMQEFLRDVVPETVRAGGAWLDAIRCRERLVAVSFHLLDKRSVSYYQGGFDPAYAAYRPMTTLFARVIERAIAEGYRHFDFLRGEELYKYRWGAEAVYSADIFMRRPSAYASMLQAGVRYYQRLGNAFHSRFGHDIS